MITITQRDPKSIDPHPLITAMPRWGRDTEEWRAFLADIIDHGIQEPLKVLHGSVVVDGETRRQAAVELGLPTVPTVEVSEHDCVGIVIRNLSLRRNLTKGQTAYYGYPLIAHRLEELRVARQVKCGGAGPLSDLESSPQDAHTVALSLGVGTMTLYQAKQIHEILAAHPSFKASTEASIMSGAGLGGVLAGLGYQVQADRAEQSGRPFTGGRPVNDTDRQLKLFRDLFRTEDARWEYWSKWGAAEREAALGAIDEFAFAAGPEVSAERAEYHKLVAQRYAKAAKKLSKDVE